MFLNNNNLVVNKSKTVLQEMMLKQKRCKIGGNPPELVTWKDNGEMKIVKTKDHSILLGGTLQNDLQWRAHIESGEKPLLSTIRKKLGALKYLGGGIPRKSRLMLTNGLILSRILYLLPLYGVTQTKYMHKIQVLMNNAIRFVTGKNKRTKTMTLMKEVGWLNVYELQEFHLMLLTWRIIRLRAPKYLAEKVNS